MTNLLADAKSIIKMVHIIMDTQTVIKNVLEIFTILEVGNILEAIMMA